MMSVKNDVHVQELFNLRDMVVVENIKCCVSSFTEDSLRIIIFSK